jgi:hypothetical protein
VPVFLTGNLPMRNPAAMYEFILCMKQLGIKFPKDICKIIYENLRLVALDDKKIYYSRLDPSPIGMSTFYDFAIVTTQTAGTIRFNDLGYELDANGRYFFFAGAFRHLSVSIWCSQFSIEYHSLLDHDSLLCRAIYTISGGINSSIGTQSLLYLNDTIYCSSDKLVRLPREKFKDAIDTCLKYGLINLEDKLEKEHLSWLDHHGNDIVLSQSRESDD